MQQQQHQQRRQQLAMTCSSRWLLVSLLVAVVGMTVSSSSMATAFTTPFGQSWGHRSLSTATTTSRKADAAGTARSMAEDDSSSPQPRTFREAEILGLKRMQQGDYKEALNGMYFVVVFCECCVTECVSGWSTRRRMASS
jgi:hypothetical protein